MYIFTRLLTVIVLLLTSFVSWSQYGGTGTFTRITSTGDLTDGYYVIAYGTSNAMNNSYVSSTYFDQTSISPTSGVITNPAVAIVWKIETNGGGRSIYNESINRYVSYTGSSNNVQSVTSVSGNNQRWTFAYNGSVFTVTNLAVTSRMLQYNTGAPRFACYTGSQQNLTLYKMAASAGPTITPTPTSLTGLNYVTGSGPSTAQSFTLAASNLTAGGGTITISGSTNYEVSVTNATTGFGSSVTLPYTSTGTLGSNTVWVRLKAGLAVGNYNLESIAISGGAATSSVTVSGSVTALAAWEDFEIGTKTGYSIGNVTCTAGSWSFDNALIGSSASDFYEGTQGTRIQTSGKLSMNFNLTSGLGSITLKHGTYGSDGNTNWRIEVSNDNGASWTAFTSSTYTATSSTFATQVVTVNLSGNVRFRIVNLQTSGTYRLNIDDIYVTPYNSPEISIKQGSTNIASGGNHNYGSLCETGVSQNTTFTIENTGSLPLSLTGLSPYVTLTGSGDFTLTTTPSTPIASASNTTFNITFDPSSAGLKTATISIANNDSDENPYTFTVQGTGTAAVAPAVNIMASPSGPICAGTPITFSPTPSNIGGGTATYEWFKNSVSQGISATYGGSSLISTDVISATMTVTGGTCITSGTANSNSVSVTVNPVPATPTGTIFPAVNPACGGTNISFDNATSDMYWQTLAAGTSTSSVSTTPYPVTVSGTYYVRAYNGSCWSASALASLAITVNPAATVSIVPAATQNIVTGNNGTTLTATEANVVSRQWYYGTTSGGPYTTATGITGTTYTPNFGTAGTYYIVCQSTNICGAVTSNQVRINAAALQPPVITHPTPLTNTTSTSNQTTTAVVSSAGALTGTLTLHYSVNGGTWATVNGASPSGALPTGTTYTFTIPGQAVGSLIEYYFTASNVAGATRLPVNTDPTLPEIVYYEYQINCAASASGTKTIAFQGFEFVSSPSWTFAVDNTNTTPTGSQNYAAHPSAVEWKFYNQGATGTSSASARSCMCVPQTLTLPFCDGLYGQSPGVSPSSGICAWAGRGALNTNPSTDTPASSRIRNGSYSYQHLQSSESVKSVIYFDNVTIPDNNNATNIKIRIYTASISTTTANGADGSGADPDMVRAYVMTGSSPIADTDMIGDLSCAYDWWLPSSAYFASNALSTSASNIRWDYSDLGATAGGRNLIEISIPDYTANARLVVSMQNNDNREIWAIDDIQIIADYPEAVPVTKRYYRSKHSGNWHNSSTWERASDPAFSIGLEDACEVPFYNNSDTIIVQGGHTVRVNARDSVDQLMVEATAQLVYNTGGFILNNQISSLDMVVEGTFVDNSSNTGSVNMLPGSEWKLGAGGTFVKTNNSAVSPFRDNYSTGIANIPATANWIYKYIGTGSPITLTSGMFYPNLYFESISGPYSWDGGSTILNGSAGFATVKGNMFVGTTGTATVSVSNNNINSQPMLILENLSIGTGSALTNVSYTGSTGPSHGYGTGYEVKGNVSIEGNLELNQGTAERVLKLSGTTDQTISGAGTAQVHKLTVDKAAGDVILDRNFTTQNELVMTQGNINTQTNILELGTSTAQTGILSRTSGFVLGNMKRWFNGTNSGDASSLFPFGYNDGGIKNRFAKVEFTSAPIGGALTAHFEGTAMGTNNLPITVGSANSYSDITFDITSTEDQGYWIIDNTHGNLGTGAYTMTLIGEGFTTITDPSKLVLLKRPNASAPWFVPAMSGSGGILSGLPYVSRSGVATFSHFGFGGGNVNPLPVELISFSGKCDEKNIINLTWSTASELNSDRFIVERSSDLASFEYVNEVAAAGNSNKMIQYQISIPRANATSYFRLRQEDFDGAYEYFGPISVSCIDNSNWNVYVNNGLLYISADGVLSSEYILQMMDMNGKNLLSENITLNSKSIHQTTDIGSLNSGMYVVSIRSKEEVKTYKIIIAH